MAKGIKDLGNGLGYVYITDPEGVDVSYSVENTCDNVRDIIKPIAASSGSVGSNKSGTGEISVDSISGTGAINGITVNGVPQISDPISVSGLNEQQVAVAIKEAINNYNGGVEGADYTAVNQFTTVVLVSDESVGADVNGFTIVVSSTDPPNIITTTTPITGGSSNEEVYDESCGNRFFLDSDYGATDCAGEGEAVEGDLTNSIEITNEIIVQGIQSDIKTEQLSIVKGFISPTRKALVSYIEIDTESMSATDTLQSINPSGYSDGDIVVFYGALETRVTTFEHGADNINLNGGIDFETGDTATAVGLQKRGEAFYELWRTKNTFSIAAGSITDVELADDSVTTDKILNDAVTTDKVLNDAITTPKILNGAVTSDKLAAGAVALDKLSAEVITELFVINVSFETDEQGDMRVRLPYKCEVLGAIAYVTKLIEATEDATIILKDNSMAVMTDGIITLPAALAIGSGVSVTPTANTTFNVGETITFTTGKTTPGGKAVVSLSLRKTV